MIEKLLKSCLGKGWMALGAGRRWRIAQVLGEALAMGGLGRALARASRYGYGWRSLGEGGRFMGG